MIERPSYEEFSDMPEGMRNFLLSDQYDGVVEALKAYPGCTKEVTNEISRHTLDAAFNEVSLAEAVEAIRKMLVPDLVKEENWSLVLSEIVKIQVWPLRELYGDELTAVLHANNIITVGWPQFRVIFKPLTYSGAASEIASRSGLSLFDAQHRERLRELVISRIKGVRVDSQAKEVLMRQTDFGGLGLNAEAADRVIANMNEVIGSVQILSEDAYADWLAEEARKKAEAEKPKPSSVPLSEDDAEIERIKSTMSQDGAGPSSLLEKAVQEIWQGLHVKPTDEYLAKRLRSVLSSRLRDVRSRLELRQLAERDPKVGGLGLSAEQADQLSREVEQGYEKFHAPIMEEEQKKISVQADEQRMKIEERKKREAEEHAKWYQEKIVSRKQAEEQQKALAERMKQTFGATTPMTQAGTVPHPLDVKQQKTEASRFGEMVHASRASSAPVSQNVVKPAGAPEVKISKASADLETASQAQRPRLDDVKYAGPRLSGPLEELRTLTLSEFRRMAKEPQQAAQKIIQRLDVLGQESLERRLQGIQAWKSCPLQQVYMSLLAQSFMSAKPVSELAEMKRKQGEDTLTSEEITAILSLNSTLHF